MPAPGPVEAFWQSCRETITGVSAGARALPLQFSTDPDISRRVLELILAGEKTGTFAVDWQFEERPEERPTPGDFYVVLDHEGAPRAVVRLTACEVVAFDDIDEARVQCEGPALRSIEPWRRVHWQYWAGLLAASGREPARDMPILCQRFELAWPPTAG